MYTDPGIGEQPVSRCPIPPDRILAQKLGILALLNADDAMAILTAMNSEEVDIIGLTTIFGNVYTDTATKNAFKLLEVAGKSQVIFQGLLASMLLMARHGCADTCVSAVKGTR